MEMVIKTGMKVRFDPMREISGYGVEELRRNVTGKVFCVNQKHGWFGVMYGPWLRTSFLFCQMGEDVVPCR